MAKLTKKQADSLFSILDQLTRGQSFLMSDGIAVARKGDLATTTLHYTRGDGKTLYEVDKEIGSDLTLIHNAKYRLTQFIELNV